MKLYLLTRKDGFSANYDEHRGFVICETSPQQARLMAAKAAPDETVWTATDKTTCMVIGKPSGPITEPQIILSDYNAV